MAAIKIEYQAQRNEKLGVPLRDLLVAGLPVWLRHRHVLRSLDPAGAIVSPWLAKLANEF